MNNVSALELSDKLIKDFISLKTDANTLSLSLQTLEIDANFCLLGHYN